MAMATAAYNYFPNMSAKESAFFLMYGRDPVNKLSSILNAPRRYLCDDAGLPDIEALKNMYQMVAQELYNSRQHYIKDNKYNKVPDHSILVGDLVLVKDHTAMSFETKMIRQINEIIRIHQNAIVHQWTHRMQSKRLIRYKLLQQPVTGCR